MKYIKKTAVHFTALIRIMTDLRNNVYIGSKKYKSCELQRASLTLSGPGANISQNIKGKWKLNSVFELKRRAKVFHSESVRL